MQKSRTYGSVRAKAEWLRYSTGTQVTVFDDLSTGKMENLAGVNDKINFVHGSITDLEAISAACRGADYVLHLATMTSVPRSVKDPVASNRVNVDGIVHVLVSARDASVPTLDEPAREVYFGDDYLGGRILVFDMDTLKFKRGWGAYGKSLSEISTAEREPLVDPDKTVNHPNPDFVSHLSIAVSKDGIVYAADRRADRIQTFTKQGKFLKEYLIAPETLDRGSTSEMAFSPDQRFLYVGDIMNNVVWELNRADMKVLGSFGFAGHNAGGFHWLHVIATDSKGNIYTGEVDTGRRIQKFVLQR